MDQLAFLWGSPDASGPETEAQPSVVSGRVTPNKLGIRCRESANSLDAHITAKHASANRMLSQPPTRKRLQDATSQRNEAMRLERIQRTLRKLAEMHEAGQITAELSPLTTRAAVERALYSQPGSSQLHIIYASTESRETRAHMALRLTQEAMLAGIPGFFPTPPDVAEELVRFASFKTPAEILEPSAGCGSLIDAVTKQFPSVRVSYCEINCFLLDVLRAKHTDNDNVHFVGRDFMDLDPAHFKPRFDGILLNPPFERGEDIEHVLRAHKFLASGGILAAIVSEGSFSRQDRKAQGFGTFLQIFGADVVKLPPNAFKASGTGVQCRMLRIEARK